MSIRCEKQYRDVTRYQAMSMGFKALVEIDVNERMDQDTTQ